jgi:hypothetical protein
MNRLPESSQSRKSLEQSVEIRVAYLVMVTQTPAIGRSATGPELTRSWFGIVLALVLLALAVGAAYLAFRDGGSLWWLTAAVPCALLGSAGLSQDAVRRERDERGRPIMPSLQ